MEETVAAPADSSPLPSVCKILLPPGFKLSENRLPEPNVGKLSCRGEPLAPVKQTWIAALAVSKLVSISVVRIVPLLVEPSIN